MEVHLALLASAATGARQQASSAQLGASAATPAANTANTQREPAPARVVVVTDDRGAGTGSRGVGSWTAPATPASNSDHIVVGTWRPSERPAVQTVQSGTVPSSAVPSVARRPYLQSCAPHSGASATVPASLDRAASLGRPAVGRMSYATLAPPLLSSQAACGSIDATHAASTGRNRPDRELDPCCVGIATAAAPAAWGPRTAASISSVLLHSQQHRPPYQLAPVCITQQPTLQSALPLCCVDRTTGASAAHHGPEQRQSSHAVAALVGDPQPLGVFSIDTLLFSHAPSSAPSGEDVGARNPANPSTAVPPTSADPRRAVQPDTQRSEQRGAGAKSAAHDTDDSEHDAEPEPHGDAGGGDAGSSGVARGRGSTGRGAGACDAAVKPYACKWSGCRASFTRSCELARHKRRHLGIKNFECAVCNKSFARPDHLSQHTVKRHGLPLWLNRLMSAIIYQKRPAPLSPLFHHRGRPLAVPATDVDPATAHSPRSGPRPERAPVGSPSSDGVAHVLVRRPGGPGTALVFYHNGQAFTAHRSPVGQLLASRLHMIRNAAALAGIRVDFAPDLLDASTLDWRTAGASGPVYVPAASPTSAPTRDGSAAQTPQAADAPRRRISADSLASAESGAASEAPDVVPLGSVLLRDWDGRLALPAGTLLLPDRSDSVMESFPLGAHPDAKPSRMATASSMAVVAGAWRPWA